MGKTRNNKNKEFVRGMFKDKADPLQYSVDRMPEHPDPLWPDKGEPLHLSRENGEKAKKTGSYLSLKNADWKCEKCGSEANPSKDNPKICRACAALDKQNTSLSKKVNSNWMEIAVELGLEIFERQPEETDTEWRIWEAYRSRYPAKIPTYSELSVMAGHSTGTVVKAAQKWSYKVRLAAWARYADADIQDKRIVAIRELNEKHIDMAQNITTKIQTAIGTINPEMLKPGEIVALFKMATELERKATMYVDEKVDNIIAETAANTKQLTKPEDISEIVGILQAAGMLNKKNIGIKQTTEFVVKGGGDDDY